MKLIREQTIINHRKMWRWIKEETLKRKKGVYKSDYFRENDVDPVDVQWSECYCCEYSDNHCSKCPIKWNGISCCHGDVQHDWQGEWSLWKDAVERDDYRRAAELAGIIAELPEREVI